MGNETGESSVVKHLNVLVRIAHKINDFKNNMNKAMEGKYSPTIIALCATFCASLIMIIILFVPNYLGVADDGSISPVMNAAGVFYIQDDVEDIYNNYFVKTYSNVVSQDNQTNSQMSSHIALVKMAVGLDNLLTKDRFFDIRYLGLLYTILFIPAMFLLIKQACSRVKRFSEGSIIAVFGVLIFADVAYITYFNSFYPEAIWMISLTYCVAAAMTFQEDRSGFVDFGYLILFLAAGTVLVSSKKQCAFIGIILAIYCIKLLFARKNWMWGVICVLSALYISFIGIFCMMRLSSDFDDTSKFHAMTRGVLFESDNPAETLAEFGIPASYEMLTDASSYDFLPLINADNPILEEGFLDQYSVADIPGYYVRHPGRLISMLDVSIKSCFNVRRSYCGNYEQSVGMAKQAKSLFFSVWSTFKATSAPKTIGFLFILIGAIIMLFSRGYSVRPDTDRRNTVFLDILLVVVLVLLSQAITTIINSGDAEMVQHCFLVSFGIDILTYFVFAEILHKLNIF